MDKRLIPWVAVAVPLAAALALCGWMITPARVSIPGKFPEILADSPPGIVEHCRRAAELLYEVHWAAACFKNDQENDCTLPDAQAATVNPILDAETARCMASEMQARAGP